MGAVYERIGRRYASTRRADPRIAAAIRAALGDAGSVVNVGAGSGSYEPTDLRVVPVEPSATMIAQRPPSLPQALVGAAEELPLESQSVDAALAVLSVHHWSDRPRAFAELRRVVRRRVVVFTHDPVAGFGWLERYFPALRTRSARRYPRLDEFAALGPATVEAVPIPADCADGFTAAFWRRPEAYLDPAVRANMSTFALLEPQVVDAGVERLARDLRTGAWQRRHDGLLHLDELDIGYRVVRVELAEERSGGTAGARAT